MRQANAQLQSDRRAEIMAAAARCFARSGFHQASMQEICAEAGMSPGNMYRYFPSKVSIIAAICERDRVECAQDFAAVDKAEDFFAAFAALARYYIVERSAEDVAICSEIMAESRRNPEIASIFHKVEHDVRTNMVGMLTRAVERGQIARDLDCDGIATVLMALGDGLWWRRSVTPDFNPEAVLPIVLQMVQCALSPKKGETGVGR